MACRGWFKMLTKTFTIGAVIIDFLFIYIQGFLFFIYRNRNKILFGLYCCDFLQCVTPFLKVQCQSQNEQARQFQFSELTAEKLSYDYMMKQSALDSVNSVSKMLTITFAAVEATSKEYR